MRKNRFKKSKLIKFRRLSSPVQKVSGIEIERWEIAFNEDDLAAKLNGEMAEVIMPEKSFLVRLFRKIWPAKVIVGETF